jgi:glyoxalase family protein
MEKSAWYNNAMTLGIHHITAIASDAQRTVHFYSKILGLRLVKKTVNQDDVSTYHLFFGDREGHPGMDLTFFIFQPPTQGKRGNGLITTISLAVPEESLSFWLKRFKTHNVSHEPIQERFGFKRILFFDEDDQLLELVGIPAKDRDTQSTAWTKEISEEHAIYSFYGVSMNVHTLLLVEPIITTVFGYKPIKNVDNRTLYKVPESKRAAYLEVIEDPTLEFGLNAAGTVHHIAFRAHDDKHQHELQKAVRELGLQTTDVINRFYFKSIYFRIPAGVLFEIATDTPGFTADESVEELGTHLALPPFLEDQREMIEAQLPTVSAE